MQVFTVVPQLAGNLQDLSMQVTENLQSVCEACLSNARQLDGGPQAVRVAESLVGELDSLQQHNTRSPFA